MSQDTSPIQLWTEDGSQSFFHEKVVDAQRRQKLQLSENVEFYLVKLLCEFVRVNDAEASTDADCLALILKKALESSSSEQLLLYRRLGDTALYFSGFFQEYFNNKSFDIRYYMTMGESAYGQLSNLMRRKSTFDATMSKIYGELSQDFTRAVDILLDVSEQTHHSKSLERTTLSVYDAWLDTASQKLEQELRNRGVQPVRVKKKFVQ